MKKKSSTLEEDLKDLGLVTKLTKLEESAKKSLITARSALIDLKRDTPEYKKHLEVIRDSLKKLGDKAKMVPFDAAEKKVKVKI